MALPRLIDCLEEDDETVLGAVLTALVRIGPGVEAVPALTRLYDVEEAAREALFRIGGGVGKESP